MHHTDRDCVVAADPCCEELLAKQEPYDGVGVLRIVCETCGQSWENKGKGWRAGAVQQRCKVCRHWSCPCCHDWCDVIVGDDGDLCCNGIDLCCNGICTY